MVVAGKASADRRNRAFLCDLRLAAALLGGEL